MENNTLYICIISFQYRLQLCSLLLCRSFLLLTWHTRHQQQLWNIKLLKHLILNQYPLCIPQSYKVCQSCSRIRICSRVYQYIPGFNDKNTISQNSLLIKTNLTDWTNTTIVHEIYVFIQIYLNSNMFYNLYGTKDMAST